MTYRISYEDGSAPAGQSGVEVTEHFQTEHQALHRARELFESGLHHAISLNDRDGNALMGMRLQLKLEAGIAD